MAHQGMDAPVRALGPDAQRVVFELERALHEYEPLRATRAQISVDVEGGRVRLRGRTRTEALRLIAGYLASFGRGVSEIQNELVSDDQVIRAVADALAADPLTAPHVLQVDCRYGDVTLTGEVDAAEAEARAVELARQVPTVTAVRSAIARVKPHPTAAPSAAS